MSEDFAIQQQRPSAMPYALGGAAVGAGGAYLIDRYGTKYATQPAKYNSYEDLLKESNDEFKKSSEGIEESLKTKAENARKAAADAGTKWDNDFEAFKNANKAGEMPQLAEDDPLQKALKEKEDALAAKRTELEKAEIEKLKGSTESVGGTTKTATYKQSLDHKAKQIAGARNKLEDLVSANAPKEEITAARQRVETLSKELETLSKDIAEKLEYTGTEAEVKAAKEKAVKEFQQYAQDKVGVYEYNRAIPTQKGVKPLATARAEIEGRIKTAEGELEKVFAEVGEITGKDIKSIYNQNNINGIKQIEMHKKLEQSHLAKLEKLQAEYGKAVKAAGKGDESAIVRFLQRVLGVKNNVAVDKQAVLEEYFGKLNEAQKKDLERLLGGDLSAEGIETAIANSKERVGKMNGAISKIHHNNDAIRIAKRNLDTNRAALERIGGAGAYLKDGVLYGIDGKPIKTGPKAKSPIVPKINLPTGAKVPEAGINFEYTVGEKVALTEEQIAQKAKAAVTDEMVKAEKEAVETARKAVDEARAKLPRNPEKSLETLAKEFAEANGSREDAVKKATEPLKEDLKKLFEGKVNNKKLAGILAGGAAVGLLIGAAMRPKAKEA